MINCMSPASAGSSLPSGPRRVLARKAWAWLGPPSRLPTMTQMKISGRHRSETTGRAWLRGRAYISTVSKHSDTVMDAQRDAITGAPLDTGAEWLHCRTTA